jgi:hypothetical protein
MARDCDEWNAGEDELYEYTDDDSTVTRVSILNQYRERCSKIEQRFQDTGTPPATVHSLQDSVHDAMWLQKNIESYAPYDADDFEDDVVVSAHTEATLAVEKALAALVGAAYVISPPLLPYIVHEANNRLALRDAVMKVAEDAYANEYRPYVLDYVVKASLETPFRMQTIQDARDSLAPKLADRSYVIRRAQIGEEERGEDTAQFRLQ